MDKFITSEDFKNLPTDLKDVILIRFIDLIDNNNFQDCYKALQATKVVVYIFKKTGSNWEDLIKYFLNDDAESFSKLSNDYLQNTTAEERKEFIAMMVANPIPK